MEPSAGHRAGWRRAGKRRAGKRRAGERWAREGGKRGFTGCGAGGRQAVGPRSTVLGWSRVVGVGHRAPIPNVEVREGMEPERLVFLVILVDHGVRDVVLVEPFVDRPNVEPFFLIWVEEAIKGHRRSSEAISGTHLIRVEEAIVRHERAPEVPICLKAHLMRLAISGHQWSSVAISQRSQSVFSPLRARAMC